MPTNQTNNTKSGQSKRGFASMPKERVREIAAKGGHNSHGGVKAAHKDEG